MNRQFWFVDDDQHLRWAVRVCQPFTAEDGATAFEARIVFTSQQRQISTDFVLAKPESELSQYEILELLAEAKREAASAELSTLRLYTAA